MPYNNVSYQINYAVNQRLLDFFAMDLVTGMVYVHYTGTDVLDRDRGEDRHRIFFTIVDNFLSERGMFYGSYGVGILWLPATHITALLAS